jgi:tetratricopeptide (TPR) repeat protein
MRRILPLLLAACLLLAALPAAAQDVTVPPPVEPQSDVTTQTDASSLAQLEAAAARAEDAAAEAERYANDTSNYLGVFESVGVAIGVFTGIIVPLLAVLAGILGLTRLNQAKAELSEAQEEFERKFNVLAETFQADLRQKQAELDALKAELQASAQDERIRSEEATIALSMLPLAERQYQVKDYDGALESYRRALALDPTNAVIHYRLGYVYTQTGRLDAATDHLNKALDIDPQFALALANLGYVLRRRADDLPKESVEKGRLLAEAELKLRQALTLSPKLVDEDGESWWGSLGGLHRRRGQIDDAIDAYRRAQRVTPAASYPVANLALLFLQKGDRERMQDAFQRAERLAQRGVLADGRDFWAWADLMVAQLALGKFSDAQVTLEWVLMSVPEAAPRVLGQPLDTLKQLAQRATPESAERLRPFIDRLEAQMGDAKHDNVADKALR